MDSHVISSIEALEAVYKPRPSDASMVKESTVVTDEYKRLIEASPFVALASVGAEEIDCSPRGDRKGFVRVQDERTLMLPDRKGNNRLDTLRNIVLDPRVALMFMIPGSGTILRVIGKAHLTTNPELLASFEEQGKPPRSVIVIKVTVMYFQCARAVLRAKLWSAAEHVEPGTLPTPGEILAARTAGRPEGAIDSKAYDEEWPGRAEESMW